MTSTLVFLTTIVVLSSFVISFNEAKICYQCDDLNPSSRFKFWGEKITRCNGVPFEKYATRTSRAFGAAVLTCYTKFNESGHVIKRDAYGLGESFDKSFKCRDRFHICCRTPSCNKHTQAPCPPIAKVTEKKEVKACYTCKGAENCRSDKLNPANIRTSSLFGAKNLICYTKFDPKTGQPVQRDAFGFGELVDKSLKCDSKFFVCCYENMCNTHDVGLCRVARNQTQHH